LHTEDFGFAHLLLYVLKEIVMTKNARNLVYYAKGMLNREEFDKGLSGGCEHKIMNKKEKKK